jgi:hypothetical protein
LGLGGFGLVGMGRDLSGLCLDGCGDWGLGFPAFLGFMGCLTVFRGYRLIRPIFNNGVDILLLLYFPMGKKGLPFWGGIIKGGMFCVVPILDSIGRVIHCIVGILIT